MSLEKSKTEETPFEGVKETVKIIIHALILAMLVRIFLFQPFNIPSSSMKSTLMIGDYLFVSKFSYGFSRYSFPFSPDLFSGRIWASDPKRGDVVVFRAPHEMDKDFIKRLIGLPGDRIQMMQGVLYINGNEVPKKYVDDFTYTDVGGEVHKARRYEETLPNGVKYYVLDEKQSDGDTTGVFIVPEGHYFMMGDNRDNSDDSRGNVRFVPFENFVGRARILFFSVNVHTSWWPWTWPTGVRWSRIFNIIR